MNTRTQCAQTKHRLLFQISRLMSIISIVIFICWRPFNVAAEHRLSLVYTQFKMKRNKKRALDTKNNERCAWCTWRIQEVICIARDSSCGYFGCFHHLLLLFFSARKKTRERQKGSHSSHTDNVDRRINQPSLHLDSFELHGIYKY